MPAQEL